MFSAQEVSTFDAPTERVFLGLVRDAARFGLSFPQEAIETLKSDQRFHVTDLRSIAVQGLVPADHLAPLAEAKALLHWHGRRHFCSNCGHPTEVVQAGWRRDCTHCKAQHFPRTDPVVIMLAVSGDQCLLGRQSRFVSGMWSCLAGFVEPGETIEEAARRETLEEAGIRCGTVRYFASQPWPFPSSLMIGCHAEAISHDIVVDHDELEDARWFSRDEAAAMLMRAHPDGLGTPPPMAIAHHIIRAWVERGDGVFA
jgi:NAD+ diphosphatase